LGGATLYFVIRQMEVEELVGYKNLEERVPESEV